MSMVIIKTKVANILQGLKLPTLIYRHEHFLWNYDS